VRDVRWERAVSAMGRRAARVAFLVNVIAAEQVGELLPEKSTHFYPQLLSGMTIYCLDAP